MVSQHKRMLHADRKFNSKTKGSCLIGIMTENNLSFNILHVKGKIVIKHFVPGWNKKVVDQTNPRIDN